MQIMACDRCGRLIRGATPCGFVEYGQGVAPGRRLDLCLECVAELRYWLQQTTLRGEEK